MAMVNWNLVAQCTAAKRNVVSRPPSLVVNYVSVGNPPYIGLMILGHRPGALRSCTPNDTQPTKGDVLHREEKM
jgi:hypothetical protein